MRPSSDTHPFAGDPAVVETLGVHKPKGVHRARNVVLLVLAVAALAATIAAVRTATRDKASPYRTDAVRRGDLTVTVTATGTVEPRNTVEVGAEVSGRVVEVGADFNDVVKRGQVLVQIDRSVPESRLEQARANLAAARAAVAEARATAADARITRERNETLFVRGAISAQQRDTARTNLLRTQAAVQSTLAQVKLAQAAVDTARTDLDKTTVRSPIDGVVLSRHVERGQTVVATFQTPLLFLLAEDLSRMELDADVDEADMGEVRAGQHATFTVDAYPNRTFDAVVTSVHDAPQTVQNVVTYETVLSVDNPDKLLRPGMTATVDVVTETRHDVLLVPNAALRFRLPNTEEPVTSGRAQRVWMLRDETPRRVVVRIGPTDGRATELLGTSMAPGDRVIVDMAGSGG